MEGSGVGSAGVCVLHMNGEYNSRSKLVLNTHTVHNTCINTLYKGKYCLFRSSNLRQTHSRRYML